MTRQVIVRGAGRHVSAEGRFASPAGAMPALPAHTGPASFAFMAASGTSGAPERQPNGARFAFSAGPLELRSTGTDALTVSDAGIEHRGRATLNGKPGYPFQLETIAAMQAPHAGGRIKLRVWHVDPKTNADVVDYDNAGSVEAGAGSAIAGGIVQVEET